MCLLLGPVRFVNFTILSSGAISFQVLRDISIGEELLTNYGNNYFGLKNCECMCFTCESFGRGRYSQARIAADNLGYNPDGKMITRSTYKHAPIIPPSSLDSLCTYCKKNNIEKSKSLNVNTEDCCIRCSRHFALFNNFWPNRTSPDVIIPTSKLKRKIIQETNDYYDSETGSSTTLVSSKENSPPPNVSSFSTNYFDYPYMDTLDSLKSIFQSLESKRSYSLDFLANGNSIYGDDNRFYFNPRLMFKGKVKGTPVIFKSDIFNSTSDSEYSLKLGLIVEVVFDIAFVKEFNTAKIYERNTKDISLFIPTEDILDFYSKDVPIVNKKKYHKNINTTNYEQNNFYLSDRSVRLAIAYYEHRFLAPKGKLSLFLKNNIVFFTKNKSYKCIIKRIKLRFDKNRKGSKPKQFKRKTKDSDFTVNKKYDFNLVIEGVNESAYHIYKNDLGKDISTFFDLSIPFLRYSMFFPKCDNTVYNYKFIKLPKNSAKYSTSTNIPDSENTAESPKDQQPTETFDFIKLEISNQKFSAGIEYDLDSELDFSFDNSENYNELYTKLVESYCYGIGHKVKVLDTRDYRIHEGRIEDVSFIHNSSRHGLYYYIHFIGWSKNFDSWVPPSCIIHS
ncbi:Histone-lysine N-methyltransferase set9 [Smittium culicis]|uniref:Histone-lysine N-methyltransferase set9 n=1 Tax=Smittium culicis TaxID=133412 RepID=A0A1R1YMS4_9FUNG|nr:Histone-lysine N-methyltransferase set9 [Smittium culicis]